MGYEITTVNDRRALTDFLRLPFRVYRGNPHWVPPITAEVRRTLDASGNPYFADATLDLFLCSRDGLPHHPRGDCHQRAALQEVQCPHGVLRLL